MIKIFLVCTLFAVFSLPALAGKNPPHVILISVDTLSARFMSLYGYPDTTTPEMAKFAREAITFENAQSVAAYTLPSHMSLFTGVYPQTHQVFMGEENGKSKGVLNPRFKTLPQYLKGVGYKNLWAAINVDPYLSLRRGFERGFDQIVPMDFALRWSEEKINGAIADLKVKENPAFIFFHTYYVHDVYKPSRPHEETYDPSYSKKIIQTWPEVFTLLKTEYWRQFDLNDPKDIFHVRSLYIGGIRTFDEHFGKLMNLLKQRDLYDQSIIIVTSDHGEAFGERGSYMHSAPYREELHVPLIIKIPGRSPKRISTSVYLTDVLPTILNLLGIKPAKEIEGVSLVPLMEDKKIKRFGPILMQGYKVNAMIKPPWKLVRSGPDNNQLFKVDVDPYETHDYREEYAKEAAELNLLYEKESADRAANFTSPDTRIEKRKLRWVIVDRLPAAYGPLDIYRNVDEGDLHGLSKMMEEGAYGYSAPIFKSNTILNLLNLVDGDQNEAAQPKAWQDPWDTFLASGKSVFLHSLPMRLPTSPKINFFGSRGVHHLLFESEGLGPQRHDSFGKEYPIPRAGNYPHIVKTRFAKNKSVRATLDVYGLEIPIQLLKEKDVFSKIKFKFPKQTFELGEKESSRWIHLELPLQEYPGPSSVRVLPLKITKNGNFRIRVLMTGPHQMKLPTNDYYKEMTDTMGLRINQFLDWPKALKSEPDVQAAIDAEFNEFLSWHKRSHVYSSVDPDPDVLTHYIPIATYLSANESDQRGEKTNSVKQYQSQHKKTLSAYRRIDDIFKKILDQTHGNTIVVLSAVQGQCLTKKQVYINNLFARKGWLHHTVDTKSGHLKINWNKSKAVFANGNQVFISPNGFGKKWVRGSGQKYEQLRQQILNALKELKDLSGKSPFFRVLSREEAVAMPIETDENLGDIVLESHFEYALTESIDASKRLWGLKTNPKQLAKVEKNCDQTPFLIWGPGIKRRHPIEKPIQHRDQLPTILKALGIPAPKHLTGRVLTEVFE